MFDYEIKIDGSALADDIQIREILVNQHSHLPHMFTIVIDDNITKLQDSNEYDLDLTKFELAKAIEISAAPDADAAKTTLIKGEITALEHEFDDGLIHTIRGYDKSHRLFRESKSQAFLNIKDSDLASQFAGNAGLSAQVDATSTVYEHLYQDNQTDLAFLMQRAWRIGYECFVDDGKLYFRKPPSSGSTTILTYGDDIISCSISMTLAEQVDSVEVKGWDPKTLKAILGKSEKGTLYPKNGDTKQGAKWASTFGTGKHTFVDIPVVSQAEANKIAEARLNELSGAFVTAEVVTMGNPNIKAGRFVKLENVGTQMSGTYMITSATHIMRDGDYLTELTVSGTRTGLLTEQMAHQEPVKRWPSVVTAVVTNTDDPENWGRVKVKYPWMSEEAESFWARLAAPGGGKTAGFIAIPEVEDEVIVAFEYGDINFPVILGGLWNGKHAIPAAPAGAATGEKPLVRSWQSINGHYMAMHDDADKKIEMMTSGGHLFIMDDTNKKIEIKTNGGHTITLDDNGKKVIVKSSGDIEITSPQNIKIDAGANLEMNAKADVKIAGLNVNATAQVGATIKGNASAEVSASGTTTIKGTLVQIN